MSDNKTVISAMTLQRAAQLALDVQTACNLSGVARSFAEIMLYLRSLGLDTDRANRHPIARLFAEQISHLSGAGVCSDSDTYSRAYDACTDLARLPDVQLEGSSGSGRFSEGTAGEDARDKWARRYDELNGAPESEEDR